MKQGLTELIFILDRSGSMSGLEKDVIGGFNSLIAKEKGSGEAAVTLVLFDDKYESPYVRKNIIDVLPLTDKEYYPRGGTALLDAVGKTVNEAGARLNELPEDEKPSKVIVIIQTDGYENSSREFTKSAVKALIKRQQDVYSWEFMFLGANIDAAAEAESIGINRARAAKFKNTSDGIKSQFRFMSAGIDALKTGGEIDTNGTNDGSCDDLAETDASGIADNDRAVKPLLYALRTNVDEIFSQKGENN